MGVSASAFGVLGLRFLEDTFSDFAKPIVISELTTTSDDQGGFTETWAQFAAVDAFILKQSGGEEQKYGRVVNENMYKIHISSLAGLTNKMKITYDGADYQIRSINDIAVSNQWMVIDAEKGVAQ